MAAEAGHAPNRAYIDQAGNFHLNGGLFFDSSENDISTPINGLTTGSITTVTSQAFNSAAGAATFTLKANTSAALAISDATTTVLGIDTRTTVTGAPAVAITKPPKTITAAGSALTDAALSISAATTTLTGATTVTSLFGLGLTLGAPTITNATGDTISAASNMHINAVAAAGGSATITASYMISTSVSDCFLTNAGVWTDHSSGQAGKEEIADADAEQVGTILDRIRPRTWKYRPDVHGDDGDTQRFGIVGEELPDALTTPGPYSGGVAPGVLGSFSLAALKLLHDENKSLKERLARLEAKLAA